MNFRRGVRFNLTILTIINSVVCASEFRSHELLPDLVNQIGVEFAIPKDFVSLEGRSDRNEWKIWGPKNVVENFKKSPESLSQPIIRVYIADTKQAGSGEFIGCESDAKVKHDMRRLGAKNVKVERLSWGVYPVLAIEAEFPKTTMLTALVGLNAPDGDALFFALEYPTCSKQPSEDERALWKHFLTKTRQLPEPQYYKAACGQDLQEGYTVYQLRQSKVKMVVEERISDNKILIVAIPLDKNIQFDFKQASFGTMGGKWKHGEPLAKIHGVFTSHESNSSAVFNSTVSVLIKKVNDFSVDMDLAKNNAEWFVFVGNRSDFSAKGLP